MKTNNKPSVQYRYAACEKDSKGALDNQDTLNREKARRLGLELIGEFHDIGYPSQPEQRPGLKELIQFVTQHNCVAVVVSDLARFGRDDSVWTVIDQLRSLGVEVSLARGGNSTGTLELQLQL